MKKILIVLSLFTILASSCGRDEYEGRHNSYPNNAHHSRVYSRESKKRNRNYARKYNKDRNRGYAHGHNKDHNRAYNGWDYGRY